MSAYPVSITSISMDHKGGTKSYHLYLIRSADGPNAVFVSRWGKTGQFGDLKVQISPPDVADKAFDKKLSEKTSGGYAVKTHKDLHANSWDEVTRTLGAPLISKIGASAIAAIDNGIDTSAMKEAEPPRLDDDGRLTGLDKPRAVDITKSVEELKKQEQAAAAQAYEADPEYGRF